MTGKERIDECLSTRDGRLFMEQLDTVEIVRQYGSPLFVVSEDQLRRNIRRFQKWKNLMLSSRLQGSSKPGPGSVCA